MSPELEVEWQMHEAWLLEEMMKVEPDDNKLMDIQLSWVNLRLTDMRAWEGYNSITEDQRIVVLDMFKKQTAWELNLDSSRDHFFDEDEFKMIENFKEQKKHFLENRTNLAEIMTDSVGYNNIEERF